MSINQPQTTTAEIVISERVVSNEYRIAVIEEYVTERRVEVAVDIGPFEDESVPIVMRSTVSKGGRRRFVVWQNEEYDAIRDTWTNADLMARVAELM